MYSTVLGVDLIYVMRCKKMTFSYGWGYIYEGVVGTRLTIDLMF